MSEYQYYEFKSIDKPLSAEDKKEISSWSSRTNVSNNRAVFTYSYSDFPKDEIKVLKRYFDAMFYISNWGIVQLVFKLPNNLINAKELKQYCTEGLSVMEKSDFTIINIYLEDEDGGRGWIDGEGWLDSLSSLREDIISGDYSCLYLFWLKISTEEVINDWGNTEPECIEPDVPQNLKSLNSALLDFVDIFEIDKDAIAVASENSLDTTTSEKKDFTGDLGSLSDSEKNDFLIRLLNNEPHLGHKLKQKLMTFSIAEKQCAKGKNRTVGEIVNAIIKIKDQRKIEEKQKKEEKRLAKFNKIEQNEDNLWISVKVLIGEKKTKSYEEAIEILKDLKELAIYKERYTDYCQKVENIKQNNSRLSGLQSQINHARLIK